MRGTPVEKVATPIHIDRSSPVPLYYQLAQHLTELIDAGALPPGSRLENELALADRLGLSRPTVRQAIAHLVNQGLLIRKRGVGTQIAHPRVRRTIELTSLYDDLERAGREPRTEVLSLAVDVASDEVAVALQLPVGSEVMVIERLRRAGSEPLALMRNYLPAGLAGITVERLTQHGLYQLLREAGIRLRLAEQTIGARKAATAEARLLDETRGASLLTMARTAYDDTGRAVEHGHHVYRAALYSFQLTLTTR
ncbi:MAG: GntR family transcriptional regulator [Micromonosporaceae bacterium]